MRYVLVLSILVMSFLSISQTSPCENGCTKIIYIVDNSGSVSGAEFNDMKTSIDAISANVLSNFPDVELTVIQYIRTGGANNYQITVPFTNNLGAIQTWARAWPNGSDHLPGSFEAMRNDGIWNTGGSLDLVTGGCGIKFLIFTDALKDHAGSALSNSGSALGSAPTAFPDYGEYNFMKNTYGADFTVYHALPPNPTAELAGAAIASVGGSYTGAVDPNPGDPQGSGTTPRKYSNGSFLLTSTQINDIVADINPVSSSGLNFTVGVDNRDTICYIDSVRFINSSNDTFQYVSWNFGDGSPLVTDSLNVAHFYSDTGSYIVTHIVHLDSVCRDTITRNIQIVPNASASFTVDTVCFGQSNSIAINTIGTISNYNWDFGDSQSGTQSAPNFAYSYSMAGNYLISLITSNNYGCSDTISQYAGVREQPVADFSFTNECLGDSNEFINTTTYGSPSNITGFLWYWDFGNSDTSIIESPTIQYTTDGTKIVSLTVTSPEGCVDDTVKQIEVYSITNSIYTADTVCVGIPTTFTNNSTGNVANLTWSFGDGTFSNLNQPTVQKTYNNAGTYFTQLVTETINGCRDSSNSQILVYDLPLADFTFNNDCENDSIQFLNTTTFGNPNNISSLDWSWDFGNSNTSLAQSPKEAYSSAGIYTVTLTVSSLGSCSSDTAKQIEIYPNPTPAFSVLPVCVGEISQINDASTVSTGSISLWEYAIEDVNYTVQNPQHLFLDTGNYTLKLITTTNNGCIDSVLTTAIVNPLPIADFDFSPKSLSIFSTRVCFENLSQGTNSYFWNYGFANNVSFQKEECITYPIDIEGFYDVFLKAENQFGCLDSITKTIEVKEEFLIYVPNSFTPDGDGKNDVFVPIVSGAETIEFYIFNRWGELFFYTNKLNNGWDGTNNSSDIVQQDTYVYRIIVEDIFGKKHIRNGHVNLLK